MHQQRIELRERFPIGEDVKSLRADQQQMILTVLYIIQFQLKRATQLKLRVSVPLYACIYWLCLVLSSEQKQAGMTNNIYHWEIGGRVSASHQVQCAVHLVQGSTFLIFLTFLTLSLSILG